MTTIRPATRTIQRTSMPFTLPLQYRQYNNRFTSFIQHTNHDRHFQRRTFFANPFTNSSPQTISATRIVPYPPSTVYSIISDVSSYSRFIPYCRASTVTKLSKPASDGHQYPEEAKLLVGFNDGVSDEFWSRIYCVPGTVVESVSGNAETSLTDNAIAHHNRRPPVEQDETRREDVLSYLVSRWTLRPIKTSVDKTEVDLRIDFQFANPMYAVLSEAAAPKVAEKMIEAFERRFKAVIEDGKDTRNG